MDISMEHTVFPSIKGLADVSSISEMRE